MPGSEGPFLGARTAGPPHPFSHRRRAGRARTAGSPEPAATAAAELAVQELHGGVEDRAQAETEARGVTRGGRREGDRGVGGAATAQERQGGPEGRAGRRGHGAAVQHQAPARGRAGQRGLRGGEAESPGPDHLRCTAPRLARSYPPHLHEHTAVGRDLQRARTAREGLGAVRQLQTEKRSAEPGPRRRGERGS